MNSEPINAETDSQEHDCSVCLENFQEISNLIKCPMCKYLSCLQCTQTYLNERFDPQCMNCKRDWPEFFIRENFPESWYTEVYIKNKQAKYTEREIQSKFPIVNTYALKIKSYESIKNSIKKYKLNLKSLSDISPEYSKIKEEINKLQKSLEKSENDKKDYIKECACVDIGEKLDSNESNQQPTHMRCGINNCNGFLIDVDSKKLKCGTCSNERCKECLENFATKHICDPNILKSIKAIRSDKRSRMCPKCNQVIEKTEGCDQMFCTNCKTSFSFETGAIETKIFHNPILFEYLSSTPNGQQLYDSYGRQQLQTAKDVENSCDLYKGFGHGIFIGTHIINLKNNIKDTFKNIIFTNFIFKNNTIENEPEVYSLFLYILNFVEIQGEYLSSSRSGNKFTYYDDSRMLNLEEVHLDYILKKISETEWKRLVHLAYIKREYLTESFAHLNTFITVMGEIITDFRKFCNTKLKNMLNIQNIPLKDKIQAIFTYIKVYYTDIIKAQIDQFNKDAINTSLHYGYTTAKLLLITTKVLDSITIPGYVHEIKIKYSKSFDLETLTELETSKLDKKYYHDHISNKEKILNIDKIKNYYNYRKSLYSEEKQQTNVKKRHISTKETSTSRKKVRNHFDNI